MNHQKKNKKLFRDICIVSISDEQKEEIIQEALEKFNFEKVHKIMTVLNWTYFIIDENIIIDNKDKLYEDPLYSIYKEQVPSVKYLKSFARQLMKRVLKSHYKFDRIETGGFVVMFDARAKVLSLQFLLESYDVYCIY